MSKRYYKLQEFVAHSSSVNCLRIGRKSSGVLVTGGEDRKVNMWAIGKNNAIMSLQGHQSPVECVTFNSKEELVVGGAANGTIKTWDLEEAKVVRTLTGHRSNCLCVDFHPQNDFFASGSLDTNVKVWDIRQRSCIFTFKGHMKGIRHIKFSPDGKWIASGDEAGEVKVWDMTAGKIIHEMKQHDHTITGLEFHPHELILATSSADKTVKFWDLDTWSCIDQAGPEATGVRAISFDPQGRALFSALQDGVRVWGWEPIVQHDTVDVPWSKIADMHVMNENRLIGCSFNQSIVGVWILELGAIKPFMEGEAAERMPVGPRQGRGQPEVMDQAYRRANSERLQNGASKEPLVPAGRTHSMVTHTSSSERPVQPPPRQRSVTSGVEPRVRSDAPTRPQPAEPAAGEQQRPDGRQRNQAPAKPSFFPDFEIRAGPAPPGPQDRAAGGAPDARYPAPSAPPIPQGNPAAVGPMHVFDDAIADLTVALRRTNTSEDAQGAQVQAKAGTGRPDKSHACNPDPAVPWSQPSSSNAGEAGPRASAHAADMHQAHNHHPEAPSHMRSPLRSPSANSNQLDAPSGLEVGRPSGIGSRQPSANSRTPSYTDSTVQHSRAEPAPSPSGFATPFQNQAQQASGAPDTSASPRTLGDAEVLALIMGGKDNILGSLGVRLSNMQLARSFWQRRDVRGCLNVLRRFSDPYLSCDVLSALMLQREAFTLDTVPDLVPLLESMLCSKMHKHKTTALELLALLLRYFAGTIRDTLAPGAGGNVGVDLSFEARQERCTVARMALQGLGSKLAFIQRSETQHAKRAEDLSAQLQNLG